MSDDDQEIRQLRIDLMTLQIERLRQEMRTENRKFLVQLVAGSATLLAAGIALGRFWLFHT
jgi:hypothetical protein